MKAIRIDAFGGPEVLALADAPRPRPGAKDILLRVEAAAAGYADLLHRTGRYPGRAEPGFVPGSEVAGAVIEVGGSVDPAWLGRRVHARAHSGGYAEFAAADLARTTPLPGTLSASEAVALGVNFAVADLACDRAGVCEGKRVLFVGAAGGIGVLAVQIAAARGAHVSAMTSSQDRASRLTRLGVRCIMDRHSLDMAAMEPQDIIVDMAAGPAMGRLAECLAPNGRHLLVGVVAGLPPPDFAMHLIAGFQKSATLATFSLDSLDPATVAASIRRGFDQAVAGRISPVVGAVMPLSAAAEAHRRIEAGEIFGKLVLAP